MIKNPVRIIIVIIIAVLIGFVFIFYNPIKSAIKGKKQSSLLLISLDTLRADRLGCYGRNRSTSPWLDYLAKQGVLFSNSFSQAHLTTPSHMTLFTSLYPGVHQVGTKSILNNNVQPLALILKKHGFQTAGYTGGVTISKSYGFDRGFDLYSEQDPLENDWDLSFIDQTVIPWISEQSINNKRFFCFFHTFRIHDPYLPPPPLHKMYDLTYKGQIGSTKDDFPDSLKTNYYSLRGPFWKRVNKSDARDVEHLRALYDGEIRYADHAIGHLISNVFQHVERNHLIVALVSDHGEEFNEHSGFLHTTIYDEIIHVPTIILFPSFHPDKTARRINTSLIGLVDLAPTLVDFLGIKNTTSFQGTNIFKKPSNNKTLNVVYSSKFNLRESISSVRSPEFKYLRHRYQTRIEFYDIKNDGREQNSLTQDESHMDQLHYYSDLLNNQSEQNDLLKDMYKAQQRRKKDIDLNNKLKAMGYISEDLVP